MSHNPLIIPLKVNVRVINYNGNPAIELRSSFSEPEIIKKLVQASFHKIPVVIQPVANSDVRFINALMEKGILSRGEDDRLYFNDYFDK